MSSPSDDSMFEDAFANGERFYEPIEIAYILNIQQKTVQDMCRLGKILARKVGGKWLVPKAEINRYLKEGPRKVEQG